MREFEFIEKITKGVPIKGADLICGVGDDCAVLKMKGSRELLLISTDTLIENVHFKTDFTSFKKLGQKCLSVNVSDIAAMGGKPRFYLVSISIPSKYSEKNILDLYAGMKKVAKKYHLMLIGGDTTSSKNDLAITITVIGTAKVGEICLRSGAKLGDRVYVTGQLGNSSLGLELLKKGIRRPKVFIDGHNNPNPQVEIGYELAINKIASSMIDISDGLLSDLGHVCKMSKVGAKIYWNDIPLHKDFKREVSRRGLNAHELALAGGEDYQLLFTSPVNKETRLKKIAFRNRFKIKKIGVVVPQKKGIKVYGQNGYILKIKKMGYEHLR
jgi:thiamine-monophosphate kinase